MKKSWLSIFIVIGVFAIGTYYIFQPDLNNNITPSIIHIGILPDQGVEQLHTRYGPLIDYLSKETGIHFEMVVPSSYHELIQLFNTNKVDIAYFGGLTFIKSHINHDAIPLVMRDIDARFTSYFIVQGNNTALDLAEFKGKVFGFGSQLSTSGHLMPRHFMKTRKQIIPEEFFSEIFFSGAHDKTAYLVRDRKIDLGVVNAEIIKKMMHDGRLKANDIRILWETPPYANYVWAAHSHLSDNTKVKIRNAFLNLDVSKIVHKKILDNMGANSFLPAGMSDFLPLMNIAASLKLLDQETP